MLPVEDDPLVREHALALLQRLGHRVVAAGDGHRALEALRDGGPVDLLFTDVVMPRGMNGPELVDAVRRLGLRCPVLYTSGYTDQAFTSGAPRDAPLLPKPYRIGELAAAVRAALDAHARRSGTGRPPQDTPSAP